MNRFHRIFLALAGLIAVPIGLSLLLDPIGFEGSTGLHLPTDPRLLSEIRAPGGALALSGLFMWLGAARARFTQPALVLTAGVYSAYGLARMVGIVVDGSPGEALTAAMIVELVVGAIAVALSALRRGYGSPALSSGN